MDGFQYKSTYLIESWNGQGTFIPDPNEIPEMKLRIIPTSEGYYDALLNHYIYNYTDHLGNVRLSYTDTNKDGVIQPRQYDITQCGRILCNTIWLPGEIVESNTYYPFGLLHNYMATTQNAYQYKYNGKELQETGMYDYGARFYMPDIGRWGVIDPKGAEFPAWSPYNYSLNNPIRFVDPDGMAPNDIVFINNRGVEVHRIKSDTQFKTYIQASTNASSNPAQSTAGWKSVPMPNTIQHRPQSNEDVSGAAYQENDYQIAARTGYFNQAKNSGQLNLVTEGGNPIPTEATKDIPDLDPTLVKAVTVQESNAGTTGITDIMQANVPGDWSKMKSSYQLTKGEKTSETNSLYAGTRVLATKGFKGGVSVDKSGKVTYKFQGWAKAVEAYNGGGTAGYQKSVLQMQQESKKPKPSDY
ncbi:RHS repeat-associated core domain-containing protein [Chryseobacterium nematophagum]|uniref:RHS repeat-associated core domain-containing protein n=1 Tax=Chryseobacterium nematophagum TaxID=2305228 RepID=UPI0026AECF60|nr:RHS repeat-associated core domain-containing protein [Chryseobacterium nematophagum]